MSQITPYRVLRVNSRIGYSDLFVNIIRLTLHKSDHIKADDSLRKGCEFELPTEETIFQAPFNWIKAWKNSSLTLLHML
jgi:hypothetical protein